MSVYGVSSPYLNYVSNAPLEDLRILYIGLFIDFDTLRSVFNYEDRIVPKNENFKISRNALKIIIEEEFKKRGVKIFPVYRDDILIKKVCEIIDKDSAQRDLDWNLIGEIFEYIKNDFNKNGQYSYIIEYFYSNYNNGSNLLLNMIMNNNHIEFVRSFCNTFIDAIENEKK